MNVFSKNLLGYFHGEITIYVTKTKIAHYRNYDEINPCNVLKSNVASKDFAAKMFRIKYLKI